MRYAAEHITGEDPSLTLMVGVDTQVFHGFVNCGATGAITGIGNVLPREVLHLVELCARRRQGRRRGAPRAGELEQALGVLSSFDEGADLVLFYKYLMTLRGDARVRTAFQPSDALSASQRAIRKRRFARPGSTPGMANGSARAV